MATPKHDPFDIGLIVLIALYELAVTLFGLFWLFSNQLAGLKKNFGNIGSSELGEEVSYGLFMSGALGGAFYCLRALYQRLSDAYTPRSGAAVAIPGQVLNVRVWALWYLYRPLQGGVLALLLLCLVNSDLMTIGSGTGEGTRSYYTLIALGFLAGFGAHELINKIEELIRVLFARSEAKK